MSFIVLIYVLLYLSIVICIYNCIKNINKYSIYKKILMEKDKKYKVGDKKTILIKRKLYLLIIKSGIIENKYLSWITPNFIIFISIIILINSFIILIPILKLKVLTLIFCIPISLLPVFILNILKDINEEKIERNLINYIIQLKNQAKINNDIILCFKNTVNYTQKPLSLYIEQFLIEIQQGINVSIAFKNLKNKVDFERYKQLINNLENCYFNGGNLYNLLDKTQNVFIKIQNERNKRNEETMSSRIVLIILMIISIFIYFKFINSNPDNFNIMINDVLGQVILYSNFISIWIMMFLIIYVKRFDC